MMTSASLVTTVNALSVYLCT